VEEGGLEGRGKGKRGRKWNVDVEEGGNVFEDLSALFLAVFLVEARDLFLISS